MSSKKPFDYIDEKIKEAADKYQPAFNELAWKALEEKLDYDKKKHRPFLWWFVLPLLVAGSWGIYYKFNNAENLKENPVAESNAASATSHVENKNAVEKNTSQNNWMPTVPVTPGNSAGNKTSSNEEDVKVDVAEKRDNRSVVAGNAGVSINAPSSSMPAKTNKISYRKKGKIIVNSIGHSASAIDEDKIIEEDKGAAGTGDGIDKNIVAKKEDDIIKKETTVEGQSKAVVADGNKEDKKQTARIITTKEEENPVVPKIEKSKKSKGFYVLASGGIDAGSTKLFPLDNCTATAKYGIGVGYQFNKRLSVQTGFYSNMKKYAAAPADYTIKPGSPMGAYPLHGIKATNLVYEIPLAVKYDFFNKPSVILYATAGVSSYIMQKEKYACFYSYYNNLYEQDWLYTGNKHFLSTAVFSIGMEKKIFKQFFLLAEPSVSMPITGVGDGKMKIYSSALQLGLKYYLFKKN